MSKTKSQFQLLLKAISTAACAHEGQLRKDKCTPYASHPFRVAMIVQHLFAVTDERVLMAAVLHDIIEDTTTDYDDLKKEFGREVATWVQLLSKDKRLDEEIREKKYRRQLAGAPEEVKLVKLADMFDNLTDAGDLSHRKKVEKTKKRIASYLGSIRQRASRRLQAPIDLVEQLLKRT